jgi:hypothetical protein
MLHATHKYPLMLFAIEVFGGRMVECAHCIIKTRHTVRHEPHSMHIWRYGVKAIYLKGFGEPELSELRELPGSDIRPHDLIVAVRGCWSDRADLNHRKGAYQPDRLRTSAGTLESSDSRCCGDLDSILGRPTPERRYFRPEA